MNNHYSEIVKKLTEMRSLGHSVEEVASHVTNLTDGANTLEKVILQENDTLKCEALDVLFEMRHTAALRLAEALLGSASKCVRWAVCDIMADMPGNKIQAESLLLKQLQCEADPHVRFAAVYALARIGTDRALPVLTEISAGDPSTDFEGRPISELAMKAIKLINEATT